MIDLRNRGLPNAILVNGKPCYLNTDYRYWIQFYADLENDNEERDISYLFVDDPPVIDDDVLNQLMQFLYNPSATPKSDGASDKTLDYILDGEYIFSALYATYGIDIIEMDMHWHKFLALCNNVVGDGTLWGYAKSMRGYSKPSKKDTYERQCMRAKQAWSFPIKLTEEEQRKKDEFDEYFG